jgi:hypothetical protein
VILGSARAARTALLAGGVLLAAIGALACTSGPWPLAVLGALSVVVGVLVALAGIGVHARLNRAGSLRAESELDARIMAVVRRSGADSCSESGSACTSCDLGCASRVHP